MLNFDIPETQTLGVMILGFILGAIALPYFMKRPLFFLLVGGSGFFAIRYVIAIFSQQKPGVVIGNGIVTAGLMWIIYIGMMFIGDYVVRRRFQDYYDE